jgi:nicotinamide phosphoribosyltransferase
MNLITLTDFYKASHYLQYPEGTTYLHAYLESRGGKYGWTKFFGLQYILEKYLSQRVTVDDVEEAKEVFERGGLPFNYEGWLYIAQDLKGKIPLRIRAVREGTVVPNHNVLMTVESTNEQVPWVVGWFETLLLQVWYPITVATLSHKIKTIIQEFSEKSDEPGTDLQYKLNDFGVRGTSSMESAEIGGLAHLANFNGSDNVPAFMAAKKYYGTELQFVSIPAAEHSTVTSWGRENEIQPYRNMIEKFGDGPLYAVVSDSYDLFNAVENFWGGELKAEVEAHPGFLVVRPDSGDPVTVVMMTLRLLDKKFGHTVNSKGFKVLNHVRVIQGDGINEQSIYDLCKAITDDGFALENLNFGMGGALLQGINRDTHAFAYKTSAIEVNDDMRDVYKDPVTQKGKMSKKGILDLVYDLAPTTDTVFATVRRTREGMRYSALDEVFLNGVPSRFQTLEEIRALS